MRVESLIFSQLLSNEDYARKVLPHLKDEYFQQTSDKNLFKIYQRFFNKHTAIPSRQAILVEIEKLKGSAEVYNSIKEVIGETVEFNESLQFLVDKTESFCKEQAIYNALRESVLIADGQSKNLSADAIPGILQTALSVCFDTNVGHDFLEESDQRFEYYHNVESRITTGSKTFDGITRGGFPRKTLNVLLAPPHGGKSFVMVNFARGALLAGYNVLYITLEMAEYEIGKRFDQSMMNVDMDTLELMTKNVFDSKFSKVQESSQGKLKIKEFPTGQAHAGHFRSLVTELKQKQNFIPDLIIVDYMGICASEHIKLSSGANTYSIIGSIGKELRAMAIETDSAIVTAVQTNRSGVGNTDIDINATADSFGIPAIADFFAAIINTDELKSMNQLMFRQLKNRYKSLDDPNKFLCGTDFSKMRMFDLENSSVARVSNSNSSVKTKTDIFPEHKIKTDSWDGFSFDE